MSDSKTIVEEDENTEFVRVTQDGHVATITIDRPPMNALSLEVHRQLYESLCDIENREGIRSVVLTSAGWAEGRPFGAGSDVREFVGLNRETSLERAQLVRKYTGKMNSFALPVVVAIETVAVGSGLAWSMYADIRVMSKTARWGMPEIKVGALGGGRLLARYIGVGKARELFYTGQLLTGEDAYRLGLAQHVVEPGHAYEKAMEIAKAIASMSPVGMRLAKQQMIETEKILDLDEAYELETRLTAEFRASPDSREAAESFLEKRPPEYVDDRRR